MGSSLQVDAACGPVLASTDGGVVRASGIPYAWARRFEPPTPFPPWEAPLLTAEDAPASPQPTSRLLERMLGPGYVAERQDEHCQRLSVTAPAPSAARLLPVMVWIHGGSYTSGSGDAPLTDPAALVIEQQIVVVTVTYRLGILGYLGDGADRPANLGLLDQVMALRWVRDNIRAFGGDPEAVTVFGQSAGGDAVAHLIALEEAPRLFRRAIIQSAPPRSPDRQRIADAMAAATTELRADTPLPEVLQAQAVAQRAAAGFGLAASMPFGVQYGQDPLPSWEACWSTWARNASAIDLLIGCTIDEARFFLPTIPTLDRLTRLPLIGPALRWVVSRSLTRTLYGSPARQFARAHATAGGHGYTYRLEWPGRNGPHGAAHTVDLALLFSTPEEWLSGELLRGIDPEDLRSAGATLRQLWADFARTGWLRIARFPGLITLTPLPRHGDAPARDAG